MSARATAIAYLVSSRLLCEREEREVAEIIARRADDEGGNA